MSRVLDMMWTSILSTWNSAREWLGALLGDPGGWAGPALALLIIVLVLLLLLMVPTGRRESRVVARPELLVSRGEIRLLEDSSVTELTMHVSNLGESVVQLLEVALSSDLMPNPETVELSALVPPSRSVDVRVPVEELHGDSGHLDLYFYTPQARNRAFRLRAGLAWEPWKGRFKVEPLAQRIEPARRLASSKFQRRQREDWRRRQRELEESVARQEQVEPEPDQDSQEESGTGRERLEFPSDF
jgi:hypothetical protein